MMKQPSDSRYHRGTSTSITARLVCLLAMIIMLVGQSEASQSETNGQQPAEGDQAKPEALIDIDVKGDQIRAIVRDAPIKDVIVALNRRHPESGIEVMGTVYVEADRTLSATVVGLTPKQGLRLLFRDIDHMLMFRPGDRSWAMQLVTPESGPEMPVPEQPEPGPLSYEDMIAKGEDLISAFDQHHDHPETLAELVDDALSEDSWKLHQLALHLAQSLDHNVANFYLLEQIAKRADRPVRKEALRVIAETQSLDFALGFLKRMQRDSDPVVAAHAVGLFERLETEEAY